MATEIRNIPHQEKTANEQLETELKMSEEKQKKSDDKKMVFYTQTEVLLSVNTKEELQSQLKR